MKINNFDLEGCHCEPCVFPDPPGIYKHSIKASMTKLHRHQQYEELHRYTYLETVTKTLLVPNCDVTV